MNQSINTILSAHRLGKAHEGIIDVEKKTAERPEQVMEEIIALGSTNGWLALTSEVIKISSSSQYSDLKQKIVLSAELVVGERTLHVRREGDKWSLFTLEEKKGEQGILMEESFISTRLNYRMQYKTCWKPRKDPQGREVYHPVASRFMGFTSGKEEK